MEAASTCSGCPLRPLIGLLLCTVLPAARTLDHGLWTASLHSKQVKLLVHAEAGGDAACEWICFNMNALDSIPSQRGYQDAGGAWFDLESRVRVQDSVAYICTVICAATGA